MSSPNATMSGVAKVFSVNGTLAFTGVATSVNDPQSINIKDEYDEAEAKNATGTVKTVAATNRRHTCTVQVLWKYEGASPTQALAKAAIKLPAALGLVTLADFGNSLIDGDWNYRSGGDIALTLDGYASTTLNLWRGGDMSTPAAFASVS